MDFLNKILSYLGRDTNKQFRKQVQEEKKQKYLFSDDLTDKYRSSRTGFFTQKKKAIAPFTSSFFTRVNSIKKRIDDSHMLAYM